METGDLKGEAVRVHHAAIVDASDDAIIFENLAGVILAWNPAAERLFGYTADEAIGQSIASVISAEFKRAEMEILELLRVGQSVDHCQIGHVSRRGTTIDIRIGVRPIKSAEGQMIGASIIARDIKPSRVEAVRNESEERFQLVADTVPAMIWITDVDKMCTYVNQRWLDFTGRAFEEELRNGWADGIHPDDVTPCLESYTNAFDRREAFQIEYRMRRRDGQYRWLLDSGVPRFDAGGSFVGYIGSVIDVTQHKSAEAALSTMSHQLIEAQEKERTWIARELHDDIGQRLSSVMMQLQRLCNRSSSAETQAGIREALQEMSELAGETRALSHRLHSSRLDYVGLAAAASAYCNELSEHHKVKISLHSKNAPTDLSPDVSLCLYRILQECLQNAIKHSGSRHFQVLLQGGTDEIELTVQDSGTGFEPETAFKGHGIGLRSMKERLKLVGGRLLIDSKLGVGTTITARVPRKAEVLRAG